MEVLYEPLPSPKKRAYFQNDQDFTFNDPSLSQIVNSLRDALEGGMPKFRVMVQTKVKAELKDRLGELKLGFLRVFVP
jgi:hypothetical protein